MGAIEISGVTKSYTDRSYHPVGFEKFKNLFSPKKRVVVNKVNLKIEEGEIFGLLGPNGAGKTTLIKMAAGLLGPDAGACSLLGSRMPEGHEKVSKRYNAVFARASIYHRLTGYDNLLFFAKIYRIKDQKKKIAGLLKEFDIEKRANDYADTYSTGEMMRFNLARALLNDPEVLFVDEPTIGLDPRMALKVREILERFNRERNMTIFLTTHYMEEADKLCKRVAFINEGTIVKEGVPKDLKKDLEKKNILDIECFADERVCEALKRIDGVEEAVAKEESIRVIMGKNVIEDVISKLRELRIQINSVNTVKPTLEDVFISVTGRGLEDGME